MVIPLSLGLVGKDGRDLPLMSQSGSVAHGVLVLSELAATFEFTGIAEKPVLSINRGFSAPIKLNSDLDAGDLTFLAAHDSDAFNRWQALQTISMRLLIDNVAALQAGKTPRTDEKLIAALAAILDDAELEPAFVALWRWCHPATAMSPAKSAATSIPTRFSARAAPCARTSATSSAPPSIEIYERMTVPGPYSPDATSAGRRALRNVALDLLAATGAQDAIARATRQYGGADNMTDRMAALATLSLYGRPERARALADFYARYASNALVIDKWFSLQAMIPQPETLAQVQALTRHTAFSFANPNRVRALIGAFAANPTQFNRADGAGYDFVADNVLALDPKNPQLAARLATAFRTWRTLEAGRRAKAQAALERIKATPNLSRDLADIVERALAPV